MESEVSLRDFILSMTAPVLFRGLIDDWEIISWGIEDWVSLFGEDKLLPFRCGMKKCSPFPLWESDCLAESMTMKQFAELQFNSKSQEKNNKWYYFDYKYAHEWIPEENNAFKSISWTNFGLLDFQPKDSTIWIGSPGAHTPCHYDTYGCNLVAQVLGTKRWILFPPSETPNMKPTRVPYEESSVYSKWNFNSPLPSSFYSKNRKVYIVDLKPGQVLFVPPHWWHYVESLETSISVNIWPTLKSDHRCRLEESLVRFIMAQVSKDLSCDEKKEVLNPNAFSVDNLELSESSNVVQLCIDNLKEAQEDVETEEPLSKKAKIQRESTCDLSSKLKTMNAAVVESCSVSKISSFTDSKCSCPSKGNHQALMKEKITEKSDKFSSVLENIVNALCHPEVISKACEKLTVAIN